MIAHLSTGKGFRGLAAYLINGEKDNQQAADRVAWASTRNIGGNLDPREDWQAIARQMHATTAAHAIGRDNPKGHKCTRPVWHLSVSWAEREADKAAPEAMQKIADDLLGRLGLSEHQALFVAHDDTENPHLHLVVNLVNPESGKVWDRHNDLQKVNTHLAAMEKEYGFECVDHWGVDNERDQNRDRSQPSRDASELAKREFSALPMDKPEILDLRARVADHFREAENWSDLEGRLQTHGVGLEPLQTNRFKGLRIVEGDRYAKLSSMGKDIRLTDLEKRLGGSYAKHLYLKEHHKDHSRSIESFQRDFAGLTHHKAQMASYERDRGTIRDLTAEYARTLQKLDYEREQRAFDKRDIHKAIEEAYADPEAAKAAWAKLDEARNETDRAFHQAFNPAAYGAIKNRHVAKHKIKKALAKLEQARNAHAKQQTKIARLKGAKLSIDNARDQAQGSLKDVFNRIGDSAEQRARKEGISNRLIKAAREMSLEETRADKLQTKEHVFINNARNQEQETALVQEQSITDRDTSGNF
ncbi:MAG: hypothetical protein COA78_34825 [Blastopirellula sp.]|nr:MAG: hypothetical protein COA78_34825 [Blastopirellula sp.]